MEIVVDASVLLAVVVNETEKERLVALTEGHELIAPSSVHWEIGNALSAMLRRKRIDAEHALLAVAAYGRIPIRFVEVGLGEALQIAAVLDIYAYDAYVIRCALRHDAAILTLDHGLAAAARRVHAHLVEEDT